MFTGLKVACWLVLVVVLSFLVGLGGGTAQGQAGCDNKCRERKEWWLSGTTPVTTEFADCLHCVGTNDRCMEHKDDQWPDGKCKKVHNKQVVKVYPSIAGFAKCYPYKNGNAEGSVGTQYYKPKSEFKDDGYKCE